MKKRLCGCVVFYLFNFYVVLLKKKYKMKYKKYVFFAYGQSVFLKIYLRFNNKFIKSCKFG